MKFEGMPIGKLSRLTGCNIETVRYYERIGLLPKPSRRGTYRTYGTQDVARLTFVCRARELGFTLDNVRALLTLVPGGKDMCIEARVIAASHLAAVRGKIVDLRAMEDVLADAVQRCDAGEMNGCPVIGALSSAGGFGVPQPP